MQNARLDEAEAGIKIAGRKGRRTKEPLDEGERRVKKLVYNSTFKKQRSWHTVPLLHGMQMGKQWKQ